MPNRRQGRARLVPLLAALPLVALPVHAQRTPAPGTSGGPPSGAPAHEDPAAATPELDTTTARGALVLLVLGVLVLISPRHERRTFPGA